MSVEMHTKMILYCIYIYIMQENNRYAFTSNLAKCVISVEMHFKAILNCIYVCVFICTNTHVDNF